MRRALLLCALLAAAPAAAASRYDWNAIGLEFCERTLMGDLEGLRPLLTDSLAADIALAARNPALPPAAVLFQSYVNPVALCAAETVNAALVEIRRSNPGHAAPAWSDYLVIVPEADGSSRIDDVLFATRRSDTLRSRLSHFAGAAH